MRLISWNVNHRTFRRPLPTTLPAALLSLEPDAVVLTEYVAAEDHPVLLAALSDAGFASIHVSAEKRGHNQVLLATRDPSEVLQYSPVAPDSHAANNILIVTLAPLGLTIMGIRVPYYRKARAWQEYWNWMESMLSAYTRRSAVAVGDFNVDPRRGRSRGVPSLRRLCAAGWQLPDPKGDWSYWSVRGHHSRIDHVLCSASIEVERAEYVAEHKGYSFAGNHDEALSDHAVLLVEVTVS